jgi:hypothetical protein
MIRGSLTKEYIDVETDCHNLEGTLLSRWGFLGWEAAYQGNKSKPIIKPYRGMN